MPHYHWHLLDTRILVLSQVASLALPLTKKQSSRRPLHYMTAAPEPLSHPLFAGCAALPCCVWTASSWELPAAIPLNLEMVPADEIMVIPTNHLPRSWVRNKKKRLRAKIFTAVTLTQLSFTLFATTLLSSADGHTLLVLLSFAHQGPAEFRTTTHAFPLDRAHPSLPMSGPRTIPPSVQGPHER